MRCPEGWTREYVGYLMSQQSNQTRTEFICVNESPQFSTIEQTTADGGQLHFVTAQCRSGLNCEVYREDMELSCVVCSQ